MNKILRIGLYFLFLSAKAEAQIIVPIIKANFGVDADLRANYFNGLVQSGNDDWFQLPGTPGTGQFVVDTSGAAALLANYNTNPVSRQLPFYRTMRFPQYAVVNNRLLVDAYFVRDYHGDDSTIFASGSNKNGMSPANWSCPVSQSIPDKNEILDMFLHVRRAGPSVNDSMWLFGGLSIENTTGNRYFDFELYQTDIYYDRVTRQFYNYGPHAGHTRWQFDASGGLYKPGDIILTAEYSSSSLSFIEARIWVDRNDMTTYPNPLAFSWSGTFDGDGSGAQYGYAGIQPKTAGAFYTGLQSVNNTWAGPFLLVLGNNSLASVYTARQFMEFSVNMSKLGLDNPAIFGGDDCLMPFRRVIVKTRASTSFTSELKDFIAPFDFFLAPRAQVEADLPLICDTGSISHLTVINPIPTSIYQWTTINGRFVGGTTGPSVYVDTPGVYIVTQYLQANCAAYATDTITIGSLGGCSVLANNFYAFRGVYASNSVQLSWKVLENRLCRDFIIERSTDGHHFTAIETIPSTAASGQADYHYTDRYLPPGTAAVYYRVQVNQAGNRQSYSHVLKFMVGADDGLVTLLPNPVADHLQLSIHAAGAAAALFTITNSNGQPVLTRNLQLQAGANSFTVSLPAALPAGIYFTSISSGNEVCRQKIVVMR